MTRTFSELTERYADMQEARAAWVLPAAHVPEALAKLGLVGPGDRLVVCPDDGEAAFRASFRPEVLRFVDEPTPAAFSAASAAVDAPAPGVRADGTPEQAHLSYAYAAGACVDKLFWLVSAIGGRGLRVPNLRELAKAARACGAILIVDNTLPSAFGCQPLAQGAHIVMEELDRVGEGKLEQHLVGLAVARSIQGSGRHRRIDPTAEGAYVLLAMRLGQGSRCEVCEHDLKVLDAGMDTLERRMQRHMDNARALAEYLNCHPLVPYVCYPGLPNHVSHEAAASTLRHGFGSVIDFELPKQVSAGSVVFYCDPAHRRKPAGGPKTRFVAPDGSRSRLVRIYVGTNEPLAVADTLDLALRMFTSPQF